MASAGRPASFRERSLTIPRSIEFIAVSNYEHGSTPSGAVRLVLDVRESIQGRHVIVVEDIVRKTDDPPTFPVHDVDLRSVVIALAREHQVVTVGRPAGAAVKCSVVG